MRRSKHSLSHYRLFTGMMGKLIPIGCFEVLPGDSIQQATSLLLRVSPLAAPVMHPVSIRVHHWFVPNRILWNGWEDFITGGADGIGGSSGTRPYITTPGSPGSVQGSLHDYLGIPPGLISRQVSALPFRAYASIFNEFYRDEDLVTPLTVSKASGSDTTTNQTLQSIAWEKDPFTSARPWPQKGPDVTLPLGDKARIAFDADPAVAGDLTAWSTVANARKPMNAASSLVQTANGAPTPGSSPYDLYADLDAATSVDITTVREAFALQRYQEARARYGSRYTEYLRYLGVRSSDARLQRPEYLGGGKQTISFSEVLQTAPDVFQEEEENTGVGNLQGHGIAAMRSRRYRRFFEEHGLVLSLMSVRPRTMYPDALDKMWTRTTKEDYWQKELELIGQQEVLNQEVYAKDSAPTDVFGYQDRYYDYRAIASKVSGEFRSTLDYWHMARLFGGDVTLNASFVTCDPTMRIYQVQTNDVLWVMANHNIQARRLVTKNPFPRVL